MASLAVTNTFSAGATIIASQHNTNFSDIVNYINNRNSGSTKWDGISTSGALAVDGNSTLTGSVGIAGLTTMTGNFTIDKSVPVVTINAATGNPVTIYQNINSVTKAIWGIAGTANDLISGSASGDTCFRTQGGKFNFCVDSGASSTLVITGAGVATFSGQLIGKGTATNDSASTGYIGEHISSVVSSLANMAATNTWGNITSISLTAGDWDVTGQAYYSTAGGGNVVLHGAISIYSGNTTTDHVNGQNVMTINETSGSAQMSLGISYRISISGTTTVYLKGKAVYAAGTQQAEGTIFARRVR